MEPLDIDPDLLRSQAGQSRDGSAAVGEALAAVGSMNLSGGAFGIMCAFLVTPAMLVTSAAAGLMSNAQGMLDREAAALDKTADDFTGTDSDRAQVHDATYTGDNTSGEYR